MTQEGGPGEAAFYDRGVLTAFIYGGACMRASMERAQILERSCYNI